MRHEKIQQTIIHTPNIHIMTLDLEYNGNLTLLLVMMVVVMRSEHGEKTIQCMITGVSQFLWTFLIKKC